MPKLCLAFSWYEVNLYSWYLLLRCVSSNCNYCKISISINFSTVLEPNPNTVVSSTFLRKSVKTILSQNKNIFYNHFHGIKIYFSLLVILIPKPRTYFLNKSEMLKLSKKLLNFLSNHVKTWLLWKHMQNIENLQTLSTATP